MRRRAYALTALAVAFGCQADDRLLSPDPEAGHAALREPRVADNRDAVAAPARDSTAAEQCELVEIETNGPRTQQVYVCQREDGAGGDANTDAGADGETICCTG